jgi:hypothetical protein
MRMLVRNFRPSANQSACVVYEVNSIMAGQMPVLCCSTRLLLDIVTSGL